MYIQEFIKKVSVFWKEKSEWKPIVRKIVTKQEEQTVST